MEVFDRIEALQEKGILIEVIPVNQLINGNQRLVDNGQLPVITYTCTAFDDAFYDDLVHISDNTFDGALYYVLDKVENNLELMLEQVAIARKKCGVFTVEDIDDYQDRLTNEQKKDLLNHCNKFYINPIICAWYDDMKDFYTDWIVDNNICEDEAAADDRYDEGLVEGEFLRFSNGEIVRLST